MAASAAHDGITQITVVSSDGSGPSGASSEADIAMAITNAPKNRGEVIGIADLNKNKNAFVDSLASVLPSVDLSLITNRLLPAEEFAQCADEAWSHDTMLNELMMKQEQEKEAQRWNAGG